MVKRRLPSPQSVWDLVAVRKAFEAAGANTKHIPRMYNHLIRHPGSTWHDVPQLPKAAAAALDAGFALFTTRLLAAQRSADGETTKLLVRLQDGLQVESVVMQYDNSGYVPLAEQQHAEQLQQRRHAEQQQQQQQQQWQAERQQQQQQRQVERQEQQQQQQQQRQVERQQQQDGDDDDAEFHDASSSLGDSFYQPGGRRATLCVSSEVGCAMGCTFCATGTMGLTADLTAGEIIEQLVHAGGVARIRNVVFMGMGEPLNNYEAVCAAVNMMTDSRIFGLARKKVTVSTVGVVPRLLQMADDMPGVSLALSLHAPTQELRQTIVPSAKAFKLDKLMAAVEAYQQRSGRTVFVEYVMLGPDVNCTEAHARQLGALLQGRNVLVNLIPWNPVLSPTMTFAAPHDGATATFHAILRFEYGVNCTIRSEKGQDISGACGQLVLEHGGRVATAAGNGATGICSGGGVADLEDLVAQ